MAHALDLQLHDEDQVAWQAGSWERRGMLQEGDNVNLPVGVHLDGIWGCLDLVLRHNIGLEDDMTVRFSTMASLLWIDQSPSQSGAVPDQSAACGRSLSHTNKFTIARPRFDPSTASAHRSRQTSRCEEFGLLA